MTAQRKWDSAGVQSIVDAKLAAFHAERIRDGLCVTIADYAVDVSPTGRVEVIVRMQDGTAFAVVAQAQVVTVN